MIYCFLFTISNANWQCFIKKFNENFHIFICDSIHYFLKYQYIKQKRTDIANLNDEIRIFFFFSWFFFVASKKSLVSMGYLSHIWPHSKGQNIIFASLSQAQNLTNCLFMQLLNSTGPNYMRSANRGAARGSWHQGALRWARGRGAATQGRGRVAPTPAGRVEARASREGGPRPRTCLARLDSSSVSISMVWCISITNGAWVWVHQCTK